MKEASSLARPETLVAADGTELTATLYQPLGAERGTVVINGATAAPASFYARFAEHLTAAGVSVLTYDYRGIGRSRPSSLKGFSATMTDWATLDAAAALDFAVRRHGAERVVWVGHSFGGQILGLLDGARDVAGAFLVASQLGYVGHWPLPARLRLGLVWNALIPTVTASLGYLPGRLGLGEDLPAGVALEWAEWCRHPQYLMGFHPAAQARFARFERPTLLLTFSDDDYAPEAAVDQLVRALGRAPLVHRRFRPAELDVEEIGHFGFFRPRFADTLWRQARYFVDDVLEGRQAFRFVPRRAPWDLTEEDLEADLSYGRS
jgi:predicted alpha/beta hydrolase